jgi:hypothetical protein
MNRTLLACFVTLGASLGTHAKNLQEQTLDGHATVRVPGPMVEMAVKPNLYENEQDLRLWMYQKNDVMFTVTETHYSPSSPQRSRDAKTNIMCAATTLLEPFVKLSIAGTDIQDKGTYKIASFTAAYEKSLTPNTDPGMGTVTIIVTDDLQTKWVLLGRCGSKQTWSLAHGFIARKSRERLVREIFALRA